MLRCPCSLFAMTALYFYSCLILKLSLGQAVHYILKGRDIVLPPVLSNAPDDILWKHNGDKVITFDGAEERVFPPYEGRVTLGHKTAELTIADVGYQDSGEYELDAFIRDRLYRSQYMLKVLDKVSKPVIRCELSDKSSNSTVRRATLLCSSDSNTPETLSFKWNLDGKSQLGQSLNITLGNEHDHIEYSCTATNPLHTETSVFMAENCRTENTPILNIIVPVVIIGVASLILLALCIIFRHQIKKACLKQRKNLTTKTDNKRKDEGKSLIGNIHRQENTQPLIHVIASPQRQEIDKELEDIRSAGKVRGRSTAFTNPEQTVLHQETQKEELNDTHNGEMASWPESERGGDSDSNHASKYSYSQEHKEPQSPSPSSDPQGLLSKPPEHEADLHNSNQDAVPKTDTAGDSSSVQSDQEDSTKAPEQKGSVQEEAESTLPPSSALSHSTHEKEIKVTDAENVGSAQVSEETEGNTDKKPEATKKEQQ